MVTPLIDLPIRGGPGPLISSNNFASDGKYKCHGDPNGVIQASIGAQCLDLDNGDEWRKLSGNDTKTGWVKDARNTEDSDVTDRLIELVAGGFELTSIDYDDDGVVETATVLWPDGTAGVFTTTERNDDFLTVDAFTITHADSGKTVTQSAVTRNEDGNVTTKPALTLS